MHKHTLGRAYVNMELFRIGPTACVAHTDAYLEEATCTQPKSVFSYS